MIQFANHHRPPCVLHIGMPKTASKTLQMQLFARHSQVDYLGTYTAPDRRYRQCRDRGVAQLFSELIWDRYRRPDLALAQDLYQQATAAGAVAGLTPVWSWESLMENSPEVLRLRAENLRAALGPCKIIVTLRRPLSLLESLYFQLLKRDNVGGRARLGRPVVYQTIDQWIATGWEQPGVTPRPHLEYADAVQTYCDVFGRDSVGVFLFEQLKHDPHGYIGDICRFAGIDAEEGVAHMDGKRENGRWTVDQHERLRQIRESPLQATRFRFSARGARQRMLGLDADNAPLAPGAPAVAPIADEWRQRVEEKTAAGNRWLADEWRLPMAEHGYAT